MLQIKLPTYYTLPDHEGHRGPNVPVTVENGDTLVVTLGPDHPDEDSPNLFIERRAGGWLIVISADSGDPVGNLLILDDKQVLLYQEWSDAIDIRDGCDEFPQALDFPAVTPGV